MKNKKIFKFLGGVIIFIFLCSYFIEKSGYYEYNLQNQKSLTEEQIEKFEQDVKNGKEIDLDSYLKSTVIDYSNDLTRTTSNVSIKLNDYLKRVLSNTFDFLGKFVN